MNKKISGSAVKKPPKKQWKLNLSSFLPEGFTETRGSFWLLMFFALILIFNDLSTPGLVSFDDCYYAQKGWEMRNGDDWITPQYGGKNDYINPPLFFWMIALSFSLFGKTAFAAKFFTALCGMGTVFAVYETGRVIKDRTLGWWSAFFLSTSYIFLKSSRRAMMDVPFLFFAALALLFFVKASKLIFDLYPDTAPKKSEKERVAKSSVKTDAAVNRRIWIYFILFGLFVGLAALIKTVFAVFIIGIPFVFAHFYRRKYLKHILPMILSIIVAALTAGWWFIYEFATYGKKFIDGFYNKMLSGHIHGVEKMESGLLGYLFEFGRHFWLWLPLTLWAVYIIIRKNSWKRNKFLQLMLLEALLPVLALSFAGNKTIRYVLFTFAPFVIFTAIVFAEEFTKEKLHKFSAVALLFLSLLSIYLIARPVDLKKINNADYIELAGLIQSGEVQPKGEKFYHYKGEFWINQNPLFYYCDIRLARIAQNETDLDQIVKKGEPFYILVKNENRNEIPKGSMVLVAELLDRILLRGK